ncbi:MAG: response regulator [Spirochaetaceae bacterium]|nr:response regulator [Spirochaetaceae bacterium]
MSCNKRILIVDDEKMNIMALAHFLKPQYDIIVAIDGASAIEAAKKHIPDLILLDIIMPDISGFDVIVKLKESESTKNIPVIFITGLTDAKNEEKGLSLGAVDFIAKPFDKSIVNAKINTYLQT